MSLHQVIKRTVVPLWKSRPGAEKHTFRFAAGRPTPYSKVPLMKGCLSISGPASWPVEAARPFIKSCMSITHTRVKDHPAMLRSASIPAHASFQ